MFVVALAWFLCATQDATIAPTLTLATPATVVQAGARVKIGVFFHNNGATTLAVMPPVQIDADLVKALDRSTVKLFRAGEWASERQLAPGESVHVQYELELPPGVSGRVVLQLARLAAAPGILDIATVEPADGIPEPAPVEEAPPPSDPQSVPPAAGGFRYAEAALQRFHPYEPMYMVGGADRPNARFQFSFQYQIFNPEGPWASSAPFLTGLFLGYTQSSLWDLEGSSKPFTDTNYKPELAWSKDQVDWMNIPGVAQTGLQFGVQHESNGRDGEESRSVNTVYVRPVLHFGNPRGLAYQIAPKIYAYLPGRENNEDIAEYRGYCDLRVSAGWIDGFQIAALGRLGSGGDHGSLQFDMTYPLRTIGDGNFDMYLQMQWFRGYGESLITYDEYTDALRIGLGFVR